MRATEVGDNHRAGSPSASACTPAHLQTLTAGKLTIGTDNPVYEPWFVDNKPENGKGFEGAVAHAVAAKLGLRTGRRRRGRGSRSTTRSQPGPKKYDFDINEFSITDERKKAVDFSSPYYDVTQAVITTKGSKIAGVDDAGRARDGEARRPGRHHELPGDHRGHQADHAAGGLQQQRRRGQGAARTATIDGLVLDLPTAFYVTSRRAGQRRDRRPGAAAEPGSPSSSAWCSTRARR